MLKLVGISEGKTADEKILVKDDKLTAYGVVAVAILALAAVGLCVITGTIIKWTRK